MRFCRILMLSIQQVIFLPLYAWKNADYRRVLVSSFSSVKNSCHLPALMDISRYMVRILRISACWLLNVWRFCRCLVPGFASSSCCCLDSHKGSSSTTQPCVSLSMHSSRVLISPVFLPGATVLSQVSVLGVSSPPLLSEPPSSLASPIPAPGATFPSPDSIPPVISLSQASQPEASPISSLSSPTSTSVSGL